jgi:tRNA threonylcarbamoyladenosine biosynthesis protein TsaB
MQAARASARRDAVESAARSRPQECSGQGAVKILALDAAAGACSAALWRDGGIAASRYELRARGHAELLVPMVQAVMREAGLAYAALDAFAVTRGPGTFTGLRIGLAAARGFALAAGKPLVGLTTLEVLAAGVPKSLAQGAILAVLEARRDEVYAQAFDAGLAPLSDPAACAPEAALALVACRPVVLVGDAAPRLAGMGIADAVVAPGDGQPDAADAARLAAARPLPPAAVPVAPLYLRAPDARMRAPARGG